MKTKVEMPKKILNDPRNWRMEDVSHYMSGHMYRGTSMEAFETIDSCGNCDGAKCGICKKVEVPAHWSLSVECDRLYNALVEDGIEPDIASDLVYNEFGCKTHYLQWDGDEIPEEVLKELTTPDEKIFKWMDENYDPDKTSYGNAVDYQIDTREYVIRQMDMYLKKKKEEENK